MSLLPLLYRFLLYESEVLMQYRIFHFVFFVVACKATHVRRSRKGLEYELGDVGPKRKAGHAPAYSV